MPSATSARPRPARRPVRRGSTGSRRAHSRTSRTRRLVAAGGAVAIAAAIATVVWPDSDGPSRPLPSEARRGSTAAPGESVTFTGAPTSYRIVYRVDDYAGGDHVVTTEDLAVRRPFDASRLILAGPPPGGRLLDRNVTVFGRWSFRQGRGEQTTIETAPAMAVGDLRFDSAVASGLDEATLERRETRRVDGRVCQVLRAAGPVGGGALEPREPGSGAYTDFCVDASGLLLEELWVEDGRVLQRRLAVDVEVDAALPDDRFQVRGDVLPAKQGGGSLRPVDPESAPEGEFWTLPAPAGFEHHGRFALVPPVQGTDEPDERTRIGSVVDVYVDGPDMIAVERGGTVGQHDPFPAPGPGARTVEIDGLGTAEVIPALRMTEVRVLLEDGAFVRVYGTVPVAKLLEVAKSLEPASGGTGLVYLDEPR